MEIYLFVPTQLDQSHRRGLVTDVSGPQRNGSPGTLRDLVESPDILDRIGGCGIEKIGQLHDYTGFAPGTHDSSRSVRLIACDIIGMGDSEELTESGPGRYTNAGHCEYMFGLWDRLQRGDEVVPKTYRRAEVQCCTVTTHEFMNGKSIVENLEFADYISLAWLITKARPYRAAWARFQQSHDLGALVASVARALRDRSRRRVGRPRPGRFEKWTHEKFVGMGLYQLRGTVKYPTQATPVRSSLSRVRENRMHGLKGVV